VDLDRAVRKILDVGGERVLFILLYGSVARGENRRDGDVDLAVYYEGDQKERFEFRKRILGELPDKYDVHTIQDMPLYVAYNALKEGRVIYARDRGRAMRELLRLSREAEDFMHRLVVVTSEA